jgi:hypothetical protein
MSRRIILLTNKDCGACITQNEILQEYAKDSGSPVFIDQVDLNDADPARGKKLEKMFDWVDATPTWLVQTSEGTWVKHEGVIDDPEIIQQIAVINRSRRGGFGQLKELARGINDLQINGKNFEGGGGFNVPNSFYKSVESSSGPGDATLNAGLGSARSLGPGNAHKVFTNEHFHQPRMVAPGSTDDVFLRGNRIHNELMNPNNSFYPGMLVGSMSPQIVDQTSGFGNRKSRFGNTLYPQMGPAYKNNGLISRDINLYNGARQNEEPRPRGVNKPGTFIGNANIYQPFNFGKKIKRGTKSKTVHKVSGKEIDKTIRELKKF